MYDGEEELGKGTNPGRGHEDSTETTHGRRSGI